MKCLALTNALTNAFRSERVLRRLRRCMCSSFKLAQLASTRNRLRNMLSGASRLLSPLAHSPSVTPSSSQCLPRPPCCLPARLASLASLKCCWPPLRPTHNMCERAMALQQVLIQMTTAQRPLTLSRAAPAALQMSFASVQLPVKHGRRTGLTHACA